MITVGVDIGGTFTDVVVLDGGRVVAFAKVPSTPPDLADGIVAGTLVALDQAGLRPEQVDGFAHGTTVATNAVLERRGAVVGLLATDGFEDVLEIGRMKRAAMYDLFVDAQTPVFLTPGRRRRPVTERVDASGAVLVPLDEARLSATIRDLVENEGVTAFAVCYLHSYRNPVHEQRTRALIQALYPGIPVSLSSEVNPQFREYERTCTTAFDAYLRPLMTSYIDELGRRLAEVGVRAPLELMLSRGGLAHASRAASRPVTLFLSGPAAGVLSASVEARFAQIPDVITLDMGGTSADVALISGGAPTTRSEGTIDGYPVRTPMVDMTTVGAGGGSIAWLDPAGALRVGPRSAGADPGPACYGRGGTQPTVTDASLLLGYLNPAGFGARRRASSVTLPLDVEAARRAFQPLADRLGLTVLEVALGVHRIVNASMADRIRLVSIKRGYDPRRYTLLAFGGAGPCSGPALLQDLPLGGVLIPARPGVFSAIGLAWATTEHDSAISLHRLLADLTASELQARLAELDAAGRAALATEGVATGVTATVVAAVRYAGQSYELDVPVLEDGGRTTADGGRRTADGGPMTAGGGRLRGTNDRRRTTAGYPPAGIGDRLAGGGGRPAANTAANTGGARFSAPNAAPGPQARPGYPPEGWVGTRPLGPTTEDLEAAGAEPPSIAAIAARFHRIHERIYGYANPDLPVELVGLRVTHRRASAPPEPLATGTGAGEPYTERLALFPGHREPVPTPVYWRDDLTRAQRILGPAIVEQTDATTLIYPGQVAERLECDALLVRRLTEDREARTEDRGSEHPEGTGIEDSRRAGNHRWPRDS